MSIDTKVDKEDRRDYCLCCDEPVPVGELNDNGECSECARENEPYDDEEG